jgi:transcriptional regulator with XRE-family HTH domain
MYLSNNIRFLRKRAGLSQEQLAQKFGYNNFTTVQKWESEKSDPPVKVVKGISDLFMVSMDDLINKDLSDESYYLPSHNLPDISDKAIQIAVAYDKADDRSKVAVEVALGINFTSESAGAASSGSQRTA